MGLEGEAALWTFRAICRKSLSRKRQHLILSDSMFMGHQSGRSPGVHASCVVSVSPPLPLFALGGSRQSVIQQTSRHETMSVSVKLQARDCVNNNLVLDELGRTSHDPCHEASPRLPLASRTGSAWSQDLVAHQRPGSWAC